MLGSFSFQLLRGQSEQPRPMAYIPPSRLIAVETLYQSKCTSCHGDALDGTGPYPPLSGNDFLSKYEGQPALNLYDMIQKLMPATAPGSLSRPEAADLFAYILSFNKFPAGKTELPSDEDSLKKLTIPKPAPKT